MRIRSSLAPLLLVAVVAATTTHSRGDSTNRLTLNGGSSASIDLTITSSTSTKVLPMATFNASIGGRYAGFAIQELPSMKVLIGALRVPAIEGRGESPVPSPFNPNYPAVPMPMTNARFQETAVLEPGTYRFTLFADGPTSLEVPISGLTSSLNVSPTDPTWVDFEILDLAPLPGDYGAPIGSGRQDLSIAPDALLVIAAATASQAGQASFASACVKDADDQIPCDSEGFAFASPGSVHTRIVHDRQYLPGSILVPAPVVEYRTAAAGGVTFRRAFWFAWSVSS